MDSPFLLLWVILNKKKAWIIDDYDLILKCKDDYESFPQKVIKAMSIIYELYGTTIKGIIKHDDDMVLNMEYLLTDIYLISLIRIM